MWSILIVTDGVILSVCLSALSHHTVGDLSVPEAEYNKTETG